MSRTMSLWGEKASLERLQMPSVVGNVVPVSTSLATCVNHVFPPTGCEWCGGMTTAPVIFVQHYHAPRRRKRHVPVYVCVSVIFRLIH